MTENKCNDDHAQWFGRVTIWVFLATVALILVLFVAKYVSQENARRSNEQYAIRRKIRHPGSSTPSHFSGRRPPQHQLFFKDLRDSMLPGLIVLASLSGAYTCYHLIQTNAIVHFVNRMFANASCIVASAFIIAGIAISLGALSWESHLANSVRSAHKRDRQDLRARTTHGVASPYGGRMTVVSGRSSNEAASAQYNYDRQKPYTMPTLASGLILAAIGIAYLVYARNCLAAKAMPVDKLQPNLKDITPHNDSAQTFLKSLEEDS